MTKTEKIMNWLNKGGNVSYGSLHLIGDKVFTYDVLLATLDRSWKKARVNMKTYSVTSSGHRNRLLEALECMGWGVTEEDEEPTEGSNTENDNG